MRDRQTYLIGWTDGHARFDELTVADLIPTLLFPSSIHQSGISMRLFFTFTFIVMMVMMIVMMMVMMIVGIVERDIYSLIFNK